MNLTMPIKSINEEIPLTEPILRAVLTPAVGGTVAIVGAEFGLINKALAVSIILVTIAIGIWLATRFVHAQNNQIDAYTKKIAALPFDSLLLLEKSRELDDDSRRLIRDFLNENHAGWSIQSKSS